VVQFEKAPRYAHNLDGLTQLPEGWPPQIFANFLDSIEEHTLLAALRSGVYSASDSNEYQKYKKYF
jgi:hypothetical protein